MTELKPCPFCGSKDAQVEHFGPLFFVECPNDDCQVLGPSRSTILGAKIAWNKRAGAAHDEPAP